MSVGVKRAGGSVRAGLVRWKRSARWLGRRPVLWGLVAGLLLVDLMGVPAVTNNTAILMPLCFSSNRVGAQSRSFYVIERSTGWEVIPFEAMPKDNEDGTFNHWYRENSVWHVISFRHVHSYGLVAPVFSKWRVTFNMQRIGYDDMLETPEELAALRAAVIELLASGEVDRSLQEDGLSPRGRVSRRWLEMLRADIKEERVVSWVGFAHDGLFVLGAAWVLSGRRWVMLRKKINKRERTKKTVAVWGGSVGTDGGNGAEGANR